MKDAARLYKALADETRLQMLWLLMNYRELCVCDFIEALGLSQSKASRHLRNLYHAGLVTDRQDGLWVFYSLKPKRDLPYYESIRILKKTLAETEDASVLNEKMEKWLREKSGGAACRVAAR